MIDVMLVLLCIFMIVTPAVTAGSVAEPPSAENLQPRPESEVDHTLTVDQAGAFYLDRRHVTPDRLEAALRVLFPAGAHERVLYVRAHRDLPYGRVREALDLAAASGVRVVGLIGEQSVR